MGHDLYMLLDEAGPDAVVRFAGVGIQSLGLECVRSDAVRLQHQGRVDVVSVKRGAKPVDELLSAGHISCRKQANVSKACRVMSLFWDIVYWYKSAMLGGDYFSRPQARRCRFSSSSSQRLNVTPPPGSEPVLFFDTARLKGPSTFPDREHSGEVAILAIP